MQFSFALQKHGIPTLVPPHPEGQYDLYGSNPTLAYKYGTDKNATCDIPGMGKNFQTFFNMCLDNGFKRLLANPKINKISNDEIPDFNGGWSYTNKEMRELFKHITYYPSYSILEFGSGNSTSKILDHFKNNTDVMNYTLYECDPGFVPKNISDFEVHLYDQNNIITMSMPNRKYDLILIDGPNGSGRSLWFSKLRQCVKTGSILLIDDFNHYNAFGEELDKNFEYEVLSFSDEPFVPYGEHSWKIVRIIQAKL
jgi:hypothetical protein